MKTFKYIWRNIRRNPIRSLLTILSVGFSLALMTVLYGFLASQETWKNGAAQANRIVVMNIQGFSGALLLSMMCVRHNLWRRPSHLHGSEVPTKMNKCRLRNLPQIRTPYLTSGLSTRSRPAS